MSVDRSQVPYPVLILFSEPLEKGEEIDKIGRAHV